MGDNSAQIDVQQAATERAIFEQCLRLVAHAPTTSHACDTIREAMLARSKVSKRSEVTLTEPIDARLETCLQPPAGAIRTGLARELLLAAYAQTQPGERLAAGWARLEASVISAVAAVAGNAEPTNEQIVCALGAAGLRSPTFKNYDTGKLIAAVRDLVATTGSAL